MATAQSGRTPPKTDAKPGGNGATTGYEADLWRMADALRGSMDAAIEVNLSRLGFGGDK